MCDVIRGLFTDPECIYTESHGAVFDYMSIGYTKYYTIGHPYLILYFFIQRCRSVSFCNITTGTSQLMQL